MNSCNHEPTLNDLFEIWKPGAGQKSLEPEPESGESSMTVSKLSEGLGLTEDGHQGLWGTLIRKSNEQPITGEGIMRMLACCEEILKEEKRALSRQTALTVTSSSGTTCIAGRGRLSHYVFVCIYVYSNMSSGLSSSNISFRWWSHFVQTPHRLINRIAAVFLVSSVFLMVYASHLWANIGRARVL
jgi:hypothetical protein